MKYQLSSLGWYNFEVLTQGLLKEIIGPGVAAYGGSKDGGRDAAFVGTSKSFPSADEPWTGRWIFQAKFVDTSTVGHEQGRKSLVATLHNEMKRATIRWSVAADNYILLTNVELTATTRDVLSKQVQAAFPTMRFHVIDGKDIETLLDARPGLRRSFPQLLGLGDLEHLINRELYTRSQIFVQTWQRRLATFAVTKHYEQAGNVLKEKHFVVLDGAPESGKSMIAAALSLSHAVSGYEIVELRGPGDFYASINYSTRQLFVADDVIGTNEFDPELGNAWARSLEGIIGSLSVSHKLVWTSRKYILEAALERTRLGESLSKFPSPHEVLVEVRSYTAFERASMLYNHAKTARLSERSRHILRHMGSDIIRNSNFTPERVRQLIELLPELENSGEPAAEIRAHFDDPTPRWIRAYRSLSSSEQDLLLALMDQGRAATIESLKTQYESQVNTRTRALGFDQCINRLTHSFIQITPGYDQIPRVDFQHPSLRDMLLKALADSPAVKRKFIQSASIRGVRALVNDLAAAASVINDASLDGTDLKARLKALVNNLVASATSRSPAFLTELDSPAIQTRIAEFGRSAIDPAEWNAMLGTARDLASLPAAAPNAKLCNNIFEAIVETVSTEQFYETNEKWTLETWVLFLIRLYPLLPMSSQTDRPGYIKELAQRLLGGHDSETGLKFACLLSEFEPILSRRPTFIEKVEEWLEDLQGTLEALTEELPSEPITEDGFSELKGKVDELIDLVGELGSAKFLADGTLMDLAAQLEQAAASVQLIEDDDDDDEHYQVMEVNEKGGWTPESLIADI